MDTPTADTATEEGLDTQNVVIGNDFSVKNSKVQLIKQPQTVIDVGNHLLWIMVFVDLEKAFDRIPKDLIWWCLRKKGVPEEYVKIVQVKQDASSYTERLN